MPTNTVSRPLANRVMLMRRISRSNRRRCTPRANRPVTTPVSTRRRRWELVWARRVLDVDAHDAELGGRAGEPRMRAGELVRPAPVEEDGVRLRLLPVGEDHAPITEIGEVEQGPTRRHRISGHRGRCSHPFGQQRRLPLERERRRIHPLCPESGSSLRLPLAEHQNVRRPRRWWSNCGAFLASRLCRTLTTHRCRRPPTRHWWCPAAISFRCPKANIPASR